MFVRRGVEYLPESVSFPALVAEMEVIDLGVVDGLCMVGDKRFVVQGGLSLALFEGKKFGEQIVVKSVCNKRLGFLEERRVGGMEWNSVELPLSIECAKRLYEALGKVLAEVGTDGK